MHVLCNTGGCKLGGGGKEGGGGVKSGGGGDEITNDNGWRFAILKSE